MPDILHIKGTWNCPHSSLSETKYRSQVGEDDLEESRVLTKIFEGEFLGAFDMLANAEESNLFDGLRVTRLLDRLLESMGT